MVFAIFFVFPGWNLWNSSPNSSKLDYITKLYHDVVTVSPGQSLSLGIFEKVVRAVSQGMRALCAGVLGMRARFPHTYIAIPMDACFPKHISLGIRISH